MKVTKTNRGFETIDFTDHYNKKSTLRESSGYTRAVWLGVDEPILLSDGSSSCWMLLTKPQIRALIKHLQSFLDNDTLKVPIRRRRKI